MRAEGDRMGLPPHNGLPPAILADTLPRDPSAPARRSAAGPHDCPSPQVKTLIAATLRDLYARYKIPARAGQAIGPLAGNRPMHPVRGGDGSSTKVLERSP